MSEDLLHMADRHICFDEMRGIGMPEHMRMHVFGEIESPQRTLQHGVYGAFTDMRRCLSGVFSVIMTQRRKEPLRIAMRDIIRAQTFQRNGRQRHHPVHGALSGMHMDQRPVREDITDLQRKSLAEAESQRIQRRIEGAALHRGEGINDAPDLPSAEHGGQGLVTLEADLMQQGPVADQGAGEELLDAAVADAEGGGTPSELGLTAQPELPQVLLGNILKRLSVESLQPEHGRDIGLRTPFGIAGQLEIFGKTSNQIAHGIFLSHKANPCRAEDTDLHGRASSVVIP